MLKNLSPWKLIDWMADRKVNYGLTKSFDLLISFLNGSLMSIFESIKSILFLNLVGKKSLMHRGRNLLFNSVGLKFIVLVMTLNIS